jgi:hypothetical protein
MTNVVADTGEVDAIRKYQVFISLFQYFFSSPFFVSHKMRQQTLL